MGLNALQRYDNEKVSAIFYKNYDESADGTLQNGKHIKVKVEDKKTARVSQPIKNLITTEQTLLVSTHQKYGYEKYDRVECVGKRWQILEVQTIFDEDATTNSLVNPNLFIKTILVLQEVEK